MNLKACRIAAIMLMAAGGVGSAWAATPVEETQALIARGDLDGALKRIDRFLAASPQDAEGRFTRALILVRQNKNADAIKAFSELTHDYPQLPEPYNNLAVLHAQAGDYEKARDALEAALATNPSYATAHENLGDIYAALAGAAYNRALTLDKNNPTTRYKLSLISQISSEASTGRAVAAAANPASAAGPASAPASAPTASPAATAAPSPSAFAALDAWALAWSNRDVDTYLASYAPDFQPDGGLTLDEWQTQRRSRIGKARTISVHIVNPHVQSVDAQHVRVSFTQDYRSDTISDKVSKTIDLREIGGAWKINRESIR